MIPVCKSARGLLYTLNCTSQSVFFSFFPVFWIVHLFFFLDQMKYIEKLSFILYFFFNFYIVSFGACGICSA